MKTVFEYALDVAAYNHSDEVVVNRMIYFADRRKALSYYKKALAFWEPEDGQLCDWSLKEVDICLSVHYTDDSCKILFSKTITY